jgi:hypothetical protein
MINLLQLPIFRLVGDTPSPDYSRLAAIETQALRSEAMGLRLEAARKLYVWSDHLGAM